MTVIEAMERIEKQPYYTDLLCESAREVVSVYKKMADYVPTGNDEKYQEVILKFMKKHNIKGELLAVCEQILAYK